MVYVRKVELLQFIHSLIWWLLYSFLVLHKFPPLQLLDGTSAATKGKHPGKYLINDFPYIKYQLKRGEACATKGYAHHTN